MSSNFQTFAVKTEVLANNDQLPVLIHFLPMLPNKFEDLNDFLTEWFNPIQDGGGGADFSGLVLIKSRLWLLLSWKCLLYQTLSI